MRTVEELLSDIKDAMRERGVQGSEEEIEAAAKAAAENVLKNARGGSRFVGEAGDPSLAEMIAAGGSVGPEGTAPFKAQPGAGAIPQAPGFQQPTVLTATDVHKANAFLRDLVSAKMGDHAAYKRLIEGAPDTKGWVEGTPTAGGYLVAPEQLPGYLEQRRASSPLRSRCATRVVSSDEVWVVVEGNSVTVEHVAEAATIPTSTGSVGQKISTIFKAAGASTISVELLQDTNGNAGELVASQFGQQIGITEDVDIISGTGVGQPTGIRNAAGVNAQAVDGQSAKQLADSIAKALSRIRNRFWNPDTIALNGRDTVKFETATDANGNYLFPNGLSGKFGAGMVVEDANIPDDLGAGTNETVIIIGDFKSGGLFFERDPLRIETSSDASFFTDEVAFKGRERYGFAVVRPECFEILTGITP